MLDQVKLHVNEAFRKHPNQILHFERTLYWLNEFHVEADEAFQIAAYAHDIERVTPNETTAKIPAISLYGFRDPEFLRHHQEHGAYLIAEYLKSKAYPLALCDRVYGLVSTHEVGGDFEKNLLMDCDSLSFLETQVNGFVTKHVQRVGIPKVRAKFDWMFNRMSSTEMQGLVRPLYEGAIQKLGVSTE